MGDEEREIQSVTKDTPPPDSPAPSSLAPPESGSLTPSPSPRAKSVPAAPLSRSLPPLPAIEPILEQASDARDRGDWDDAVDAYKKALMIVGDDDAAKASVYAYLGEVKRAQGKPREAELNYEKALGLVTIHRRSLDALIELARETGDFARAAQYARKLADTIEDATGKAAALFALGSIYAERLSDPTRAAVALEEASLARPGHAPTLEALRAAYTKARKWGKVVDVLDELARIAEEGNERAAYRFAQAEVTLTRLQNESRAVAFLEIALRDDPTHEKAQMALISVRARREEWAELARVYEKLIDDLAERKDRDRTWEVCRRLAALRRDKLLDGPGALDAFTGAVELRPTDVESRAALAELYVAKGDRNRAVRELEHVAELAPLRVQTYRRLFELHTRSQRPDRAWLAASCIEELGASDVDHDLVLGQYRTGGPIRPTAPLTGDAWDDLRARGADSIVCDLLEAVRKTAIKYRVIEAKKLPALPDDRRQPKDSTASIVRTFAWASKVLGIALPALYVLDDVPGGVAAVPAVEPSTALGPSVLSGLTVQELAFLAGRHLTYYRPEHEVLLYYPTLPELTTLVLAAVSLIKPEVPLPVTLKKEGERIREELHDSLTEGERAALADAVARLDARGGTLDLAAWIKSVELSASRAGQLLAGDLRIAASQVKRETRAIAELSVDEKRGDLLAFTCSEGIARLRERLGVAAHPSIAPPPPSSRT